jgi:hypothetical protein
MLPRLPFALSVRSIQIVAFVVEQEQPPLASIAVHKPTSVSEQSLAYNRSR